VQPSDTSKNGLYTLRSRLRSEVPGRPWRG
jgi:hypothetical protein